ncbi:hypothetical protein PIB30_036324 [Stylosanthes scabra]|uniref:DUF4283 domain-containing protein n=1 Tax=Stylosanthes scabra TaxID=79078 RepID=A0ABU6UF87_9FABA|nr:hypothetical protein [Stylosanthes scabra]
MTEPQKENQKDVPPPKTIDGIWAVDQRERLQRSLLGVCVKPIHFREVINRLLDEWNGQGDIECRDVGPYRCLVTFSTPEIRDQALHNPLLLSVFDEVRMHWGIFGNLSRRVWIEIMGIPVCLWCKENVVKVAEQWGKVVKLDDRYEESKSVESHPNLEENCTDSTENTESCLKVDETPMNGDAPPVTSGDRILNRPNVDDPQMIAIIEGE